MSHRSGYTFVDDSQMSVCEKINKYFAKKTTVPDHNESTSDSSFDDSFSHLDNSFANILNSNPHVTLLRNAKKEKDVASTTVSNETSSMAGPYLSTESRTICDDSFKCSTDDWLNTVSDESFLKMEEECRSPKDKANEMEINETLLFDIEEPSFLNETSFMDSLSRELSFCTDGPRFGNGSMLSPMKQVAMRRPSTIIEESTITSINSSDGSYSSSSLSLKRNVKDVSEIHSSKSNSRSNRQSSVNVFPAKSRVGFYDKMEKVTSPITPSEPITSTKIYNKENSIRLISFGDSVEKDRVKKQIIANKEDSIYLIDLDESIETEHVNKRNVLNKDGSMCLITLDDSVENVSSADNSVDQNHSTDNETPDQFNDTLEAVDYYMKQGKKILDKTVSSTSMMQPHITPSPRNRNNSLLKQTLARRHFMNINGDRK